jgi:hypothetical protein
MQHEKSPEFVDFEEQTGRLCILNATMESRVKKRRLSAHQKKSGFDQPVHSRRHTVHRLAGTLTLPAKCFAATF